MGRRSRRSLPLLQTAVATATVILAIVTVAPTASARTLHPGDKYVALGSSFVSGPKIGGSH